MMNSTQSYAEIAERRNLFLARLLAAGLDDTLVQRVIYSDENRLGKRLVSLIQGYDEPVVSSLCLEALSAPCFVGGTTVSRTSDCFVDSSIFISRDANLDRWFSQGLPAAPEGKAVSYVLRRDGMTIRDLAEVHSGTSNAPFRELIRLGKMFGPRQVQEVVTRFERGEKVFALTDDGAANLFFVHDVNNLAFVLAMRRDLGGWFFEVLRPEHSWRFCIGTRFIARR